MTDNLLNEKRLRKNGKWKEFNKHAVLIAEGHYLNGCKHGVWKEYYNTGEIMIEEHYKHGLMHGRYRSFHLNGQVWSEGHFNNGSREGFFNVYDDAGQLVKTLVFVQNILMEEIQPTNDTSTRLN